MRSRLILVMLATMHYLGVSAQDGFKLITDGLSFETGSFHENNSSNGFSRRYRFYGLGGEVPLSLFGYLYDNEETRFRIADYWGANFHMGYCTEKNSRSDQPEQSESGGYLGVDGFAGVTAGFRVNKQLDVFARYFWMAGGRKFHAYSLKEYDRMYKVLALGATWKQYMAEMQLGSFWPSKQFVLHTDAMFLLSVKRIYGKKSKLYTGFQIQKESLNEEVIQGEKNPIQFNVMWGVRI